MAAAQEVGWKVYWGVRCVDVKDNDASLVFLPSGLIQEKFLSYTMTRRVDGRVRCI